ncbi:MAG: ATP-binding protein, partial [Kiritimatiellia bacterium]
LHVGGPAMLKKLDAEPPESVEELAGKRLVIVAGDRIHEHLLRNEIRAELTFVETYEHTLRELAAGRHDCGLVTRVSALRLIERHGWKNLRMGRRPLFTADYCIAVQKGQRALLTMFNEGLRQVQDSGEYRRIHEKWLGALPRPPAPLREIITNLAWFILPLWGLLGLVLLWNWSLRRRVDRRTRELRASETMLRMAGSLARLGAWRVDLPQMTVSWSAEIADMHAMPPDYTPRLEETFAFYAPEFRDKIRAAFNACARDGLAYDEEMQIISKSGERVWVHTIGVAQRDAAGKIVAVRGCLQDITGRKRSIARILHLNRVLKAIRDVNQLIVRASDPAVLIREGCRLLVENRGYISAMIVLTDDAGRVQSWSSSGLLNENNALHSVQERGESLPCCPALAHARPQRITLVDEGGNGCNACPCVNLHPGSTWICASLLHDGMLFGFLIVAMPADLVADDEERTLLVEMADDLGYAVHAIRTEQIRAQAEQHGAALSEQLAQAQKLDAVGRLAGGVAHDFNNLLMAVMGNAELCRGKLPEDHPAREFVDEILDNTRRSADLTRQLLTFARQQSIMPRVLDLNGAISGMLKLLRRLLGEDIELVWVPGLDVWPVKMDPSQLDQVLANLCLNARDAIRGGGRLTVETGNFVCDSAFCEKQPEAVPGDYVVLTVADNGVGMTPEVLERIFEPFFTTKSAGQGTGLGLATVYGITRQNNGFIDVESRPGHGAAFRLYLPRATAPEAQSTEEQVASRIPRGSETILLVEDEASIRVSTAHLLEALGYKVLTAAGPREALAMVEASPVAPHLLLTDVVMPVMSGRELAERLAGLYPRLKCLYMSGYPSDVIVRHGVLAPGVDFLQKPVTLHDLALKVRAVLDRPPA